MIRINEELSFKETSKLIQNLYSAIDNGGDSSKKFGDWCTVDKASGTGFSLYYLGCKIADVTYNTEKVLPVLKGASFTEMFAIKIAELVANYLGYEFPNEW